MDSNPPMSPRPLTIPAMVKSNWPSALPHGQKSRSWNPSSSPVRGDIDIDGSEVTSLNLYSRDSFDFRPYCCLGATAWGTRSRRRTATCLSCGCWRSGRPGSGPRVAGPGTTPPAARSVSAASWWTCAARRWLAGGKRRWFVVSLRCWRAWRCFWWPGWCPCCFLCHLKQKQSVWREDYQHKKSENEQWLSMRTLWEYLR